MMIEPRFDVRVDRHERIPMRDGTHLSADLIRPDADGRFPLIIEYHPYRKDDASRGGYDAHFYFAERGFIGVRIDARGTGSSEGVNTDEYLPIEQRDGFDAVEWLAEQSYSNGQVGMFGSSYGGFTALQVAMQQPPHLKAIVPIYATDDRYTDDCHYSRGGNMRMYYDVGAYGGSMVAMNALPPSPELAGPQWAQMWKARLEQNEPYLLQWLKHQVDGEYWRRASLRPDYDRIKCPIFHIAAWHDGYVNAQLRSFMKITHVQKKILVGPWVHQRPNSSVPGPRIDYLNEVCRFFAHWLRQEDTGIMDEPPLTVYMQHYAPPSRSLDMIPGDWRSESKFPIENATQATWFLNEPAALSEKSTGPLRSQYDEFRYDPIVGTSSSFWSAGGIRCYLADDQRTDEALSMTYTSEPCENDLHILGWPQLVLYASSSAPVATFVAKLSDVAPDGRSALICDGSLNATRRNSYTEPEHLVPSEVYELEIPMMPTGWVIKAGHRMRLAVSGSDFPNLWPTPNPAMNRIYRGGPYPSRLTVPVVSAGTMPKPAFLPSSRLRSPVRHLSGEPAVQCLTRDQLTNAVTLENRLSGTVVLEDNLGQLTRTAHFRCTASGCNPAQASIVGTHAFVLRREDGEFEVVAESTIRATKSAFHLVINLSVNRNGRHFFQREWAVSEPRVML